MLGTSRGKMHLYECTHITGEYNTELHYVQLVAHNFDLLRITINDRLTDKLNKWQITWTLSIYH